MPTCQACLLEVQRHEGEEAALGAMAGSDDDSGDENEKVPTLPSLASE